MAQALADLRAVRGALLAQANLDCTSRSLGWKSV